MRRANQRTFDHARSSLFIEKRNQSFADRQLRDYFFYGEFGIGTEGLGGRVHRFLIVGCERSQRVLHAVSQLAEDHFGNIQWILRDEINAHALGTDQPHDLLDLVFRARRKVGEQQMSFVEKEDQLGFVDGSPTSGSFSKSSDSSHSRNVA